MLSSVHSTYCCICGFFCVLLNDNNGRPVHEACLEMNMTLPQEDGVVSQKQN